MIDAHLPGAGTPTQPVEAGYMANAYVRMKHPDYDVLRGMLNDVGETITVHAGLTAVQRWMKITAARSSASHRRPPGPRSPSSSRPDRWPRSTPAGGSASPADAELGDVLGGRMVNLRLYQRWRS